MRVDHYCRSRPHCEFRQMFVIINSNAESFSQSQRGMMTYCMSRLIGNATVESSADHIFLDGVHVIHQLAQAGRTLVAVILNCRNADFRPIIAPSVEGLRSCVGLLRRFSGRYLCGLRSADIIDEFCRGMILCLSGYTKAHCLSSLQHSR